MAKLILQCVDVYGQPITDSIDILIENQTLASDHHRIMLKEMTGTVALDGMKTGGHSLYRVEVNPMSYMGVQQFVRMYSEQVSVTMMFPVNIEKITAVDFQSYSTFPSTVASLLDASIHTCEGAAPEVNTGEELFKSWTDIQRAGFLNIAEKSAHTLLTTGKTVDNHFVSLRRVLGDRSFIEVNPALLQETADSAKEGYFRSVSDALHDPPPGFVHAGSYKTPDSYGNLQLTFHRSTTDSTVMCDVDIDDAAGIEHFFQVVRNALTGEPTNPYNIHEILVGNQKLEPRYAFSLAPSLSLKVAA